MNKFERNYLILRRYPAGSMQYTATEIERYCDLMWRVEKVRLKIYVDFNESPHLKELVLSD